MKFFVFSSFSDTEVGNALQTCLEYESPNHSKNVYNTRITPNYSYIDPLKKVGESSAQVTKETTITTLDEATYKVLDYLCCFSNPRNNFSVNWKIDWIYS